MNCASCEKKLPGQNRKGVCGRCQAEGYLRGYKAGRCTKCGVKVLPRKRGSHSSTRCGTAPVWNAGKSAATDPRVAASVAAMHARLTPELRSEKMRAAWADPERRARWNRVLSAGQRRRFARAEEVEKSRERARKMLAEGRILPFGGRPAGNGRPMARSEALAWEVLRPLGFTTQHVVKTGSSPTHYKIDFAHVAKMVAVEIDGGSHGRSRRSTDSRKTRCLRSLGWTVVRFKVKRSGLDCDEVLRECRLLVS